jgi:hypothetical protein
MTDRPDEVRGDGFLSRWSRRKAQAQTGQVDASSARGAAVASSPVPMPAGTIDPGAEAAGHAHVPARAVPPQPDTACTGAQTERPLSMDDVAKLTPESDYAAFAAPHTDPAVRNAAMKKLFADPHYNVMDGLDVYIDDYNKSVPIPKSVLRQMVQARFLGLIDDEVVEQPKPTPALGDADNPRALEAAEPSPDDMPPALDVAAQPIHENADLQLQSNDATGSDGARPGAESSLGPPQDRAELDDRAGAQPRGGQPGH